MTQQKLLKISSGIITNFSETADSFRTFSAGIGINALTSAASLSFGDTAVSIGTPGSGVILYSVAGVLNIKQSDGTTVVVQNGSGTPSGSAGGDLSGTYPNPAVAKINGNPVSTQSLGAGQDGYVLTWSNSDGYYKAMQSSSFTAGGDLSGTSSSQNVIKIQNRSINSAAPSDADALVWSQSDGYWRPSAKVAPSRAVNSGTGLSGGGDLSTDRTLSVVYGTISGTAAQGNDSRLSDSRTPTGSASGDLSGTYPGPTVAKINGNPVTAQSLGAGQDAYVLTWSNADGYYKAAVIPTQTATGSAGGDLSGTYPNPTVAKINGISVSSGPSANQVLVATSGTTSAWQQILNAQIDPSAAIAYSKLNLSGGIVNADVNASAAIDGTKISPNFGSQNVLTSGSVTGASIVGNSLDRSASGTLVIGGTNATGVTLGSGSANTTIAGNLIVNGTTTTINSNVVDVSDKIIHVNHSTGVVGVPSGITGYSVHRGSTDGVTDRDHAGLFWDETNSTFKLAYNTAGDDATLGSNLPIVASGATLSGMTSGRVVTVSTSGLLVDTAVLSASNLPSLAGDVTGSITSNTVTKIRGNAAKVETLGAANDGYVFMWNNGNSQWESTKYAGDITGNPGASVVSAISGSSPIAITPAALQWLNTTTTPSLKQADNTTNSATATSMTVQAQNATGTSATGGDLVLTSGTGTSVAGNVTVQAGGTTIVQATPSKFITSKGVRKSLTTVTGTYSVLATDENLIVTTNAAPFTITLPGSPSAGDFYLVKDGVGNSATNNITVSGNGNNIDGSSNYSLNINYGAIGLMYNGTQWNVI